MSILKVWQVNTLFCRELEYCRIYVFFVLIFGAQKCACANFYVFCMSAYSAHCSPYLSAKWWQYPPRHICLSRSPPSSTESLWSARREALSPNFFTSNWRYIFFTLPILDRSSRDKMWKRFMTNLLSLVTAWSWVLLQESSPFRRVQNQGWDWPAAVFNII